MCSRSVAIVHRVAAANSDSDSDSFFRAARWQIWGVTIAGTVLQNRVQARLPQSVKDTLPGLSNVVYAVVPLIPRMQEPAKSAVRRAFADALRTVWLILIGVAAVGFVASLGMKALPLHTQRIATLEPPEAAEEKAVEAEGSAVSEVTE